MTTYRDRHLAGEYTLGTINTQAEPASAEPTPAPEAEAQEANPLDEMTKQELLEHAKQLGVSPANNDMTKQELRDAVDDHLA